jgi:hypothetical protein
MPRLPRRRRLGPDLPVALIAAGLVLVAAGGLGEQAILVAAGAGLLTLGLIAWLLLSLGPLG